MFQSSALLISTVPFTAQKKIEAKYSPAKRSKRILISSFPKFANPVLVERDADPQVSDYMQRHRLVMRR